MIFVKSKEMVNGTKDALLLDKTTETSISVFKIHFFTFVSFSLSFFLFFCTQITYKHKNT